METKVFQLQLTVRCFQFPEDFQRKVRNRSNTAAGLDPSIIYNQLKKKSAKFR